ncbi:MAG: metallopeptidase family protein [Clostridia bacterium]|nr:metallopeptidase family protein [Clostridia bacterium]
MDRRVFERLLDEVACELPEEFYTDLNGGIIISDDAPRHEKSVADDLYIMGEYRRNALGRQIVIFYGSFEKFYPNISEGRLKKELRSVLRHEFRHHLEALAGQRDLEVEDEMELSDYLERHRRRAERRASGAARRQLPRFGRSRRE